MSDNTIENFLESILNELSYSPAVQELFGVEPGKWTAEDDSHD